MCPAIATTVILFTVAISFYRPQTILWEGNVCMSVSQSVHVTITHDALNLTVQAARPSSWSSSNVGTQDPPLGPGPGPTLLANDIC